MKARLDYNLAGMRNEGDDDTQKLGSCRAFPSSAYPCRGKLASMAPTPPTPLTAFLGTGSTLVEMKCVIELPYRTGITTGRDSRFPVWFEGGNA